ncbi:MAG: hypothetical protein ACRDCE_12450 [Cetobacterium sp.]|uniref:hypothetical protein n=1 Tax=Cetobacterium sp. TaxID=2071632 RepID=UPI003EE66B7C
MQYSNELGTMIRDILKVQRQEFNKGNTENSGASIDAMVVIQKLLQHPRYRGNVKAASVLEEISFAKDALKYAKPLTKFTQTGAYHTVRNVLFA